MKFLVVFALCFAAALAATLPDITLLKSDSSQDTNTYTFGFEQSDGHIRKETGTVKNVGSETEHIAVTGSFSYVGGDGVTYTVTYVADENGFQPTGVHLPVAPTV